MKAPRHIAIIMDGNGRWARQQGFQRIRGHEAGAEAIRGTLKGCIELKVEYLTLYAFSTENWKRPKAEIAALMALLERFLKKEAPELMAQNVRLQTIGRTQDLPESCQKELRRVMELTKNNTAITLILALSYSGRTEIVEAVKNIVGQARAGQLDADSITPELIQSHLYTAPYPDPDLLIRTSGELRLSNFLLWQSAYTEIFATKTFWPDFRKPDLFAAVEEYARRDRRYGGV